MYTLTTASQTGSSLCVMWRDGGGLWN
jgi:hypothetical protein